MQMRILMVAPIAPFPPVGGAPMRNYQLLRHLARRHSVSVVAAARPEWPGAEAALAQFCDRVSIVKLDVPLGTKKRAAQFSSLWSKGSYLDRIFWPKPIQVAVDQLLSSDNFDIVQSESPLMVAPRFKTATRLILDAHNVEYELLYRIARMEGSPLRKLYNWVEYLKTRREEQAAWGRVDGCVVTSPREARIVAQVVPQKPIQVVENGVDLEYFVPEDGLRIRDSIVFTGRLDYRPNTDAVVSFVSDIFPRILAARPSTVLTVVGMGVPKEIKRLAGPQVVITGMVPDVRPYLARAAVAIAPLRMGGGTRLKLLEAMAMAKAIVTTSTGCEGLAVKPGTHLLVADDVAGFASQVVRLLDDVGLARKLGQEARALVEARYGWASIARSLEDFHTILAGSERPQKREQAVRYVELSS